MLNKKKNIPLISIVVLNYNGMKYLPETIPPLLRMDYQDYELLIIDNHSTDESIKYLHSISTSKMRIIENSQNEGYCIGKNLGVNKARGEFILLLDEDTKINAPEILNELIELYKKLPNVGFIGLSLKEKEDQDKTKIYGGFISHFSIFNNKPLLIKKLAIKKFHQSGTPDGQAIFFKKELFLRLGGYDTSQPYYIDIGDLGIRASISGYRNFMFDKKIFIHLGKARKTNIEGWLWKYGYHFSGISRIIFKNYQFKNLIISYPFFCVYSIIKMLVNIIKYNDLRVINRLSFSINIFLKNFPQTLQERRRLQSRRKTINDNFFYVKKPLK